MHRGLFRLLISLSISRVIFRGCGRLERRRGVVLVAARPLKDLVGRHQSKRMGVTFEEWPRKYTFCDGNIDPWHAITWVEKVMGLPATRGGKRTSLRNCRNRQVRKNWAIAAGRSLAVHGGDARARDHERAKDLNPRRKRLAYATRTEHSFSGP